ncbi:uncharacterized protein [Henckelia pumila]|uniref:uncharacterized protein n=1 Tax=Henckelia pumila TaxID=405737 RepID=UPI003C6E4B75
MLVSLNDDDDVLNMIHLHMCVKLTTIELRAEKRNEQFNNLNDGRVYEEDTQSKSDNEVEQPPCTNTIDAWINCIHGVGQTFKGAGEFKNYLKNFSVATRRSFMYVKNDSEKVIVICSEKSCGWRIYASKHKRDNLFAIRKCKLQHNCCENNLRSIGHPRADAYWIANVVKEKLRGEPSYRPCTMQMDLQRDFGVELEYCKVWKGKDGCRPLIFLDGTHIKNKYKGCILVVVSKDANDDLFTIAYAIVDAENDANWDWFCYHLSRVLLYYQCIPFDEFTFFSDRHPSIIKAVNQIMKMMHRRHESTLFMTKELSSRKEKSVVSAYMESRTLRVQRSCDWKFEVVDGEKSFAVDLVTCSCRVWQINKIPCKHAISAIETKSLSMYDFCDKYFKIESYRAAYKGHINPIPTFDISESCVAESDIIQAPSGQAITGSWFEHEIALEKAHTFEWKHC